jgi:hypothetical protein
VSREPRQSLCLGILLAFTVASVKKAQVTKVIAFKALFIIVFPVEKQYARSIIDFPFFFH